MPKVYEYKSHPPCPFYTDGRHCVHESEVRESQIWCPLECHDEQVWTPMMRFYGSINFGAVMHSHFNYSVGVEISDKRHFKDALKESEDFMSGKLGYDQTFGEADPTDKDALGVTDEGLDASHDRAVKEGRKESRGRFVWPVTGK